MNPDQRARETFLRIIKPILKAAVNRFQNKPAFKLMRSRFRTMYWGR